MFEVAKQQCRALAMVGLVASIVASGCSLKDRQVYLGAGRPSAPTIELNTTEPRAGDTLQARVLGSVDPAGRTIHYNVQWYLNDANDPAMVSNDLSEDALSTLSQSLAKAQRWRVEAIAQTSDGRDSRTASVDVVVKNTPPSIRSIASSSYQPIADERVQITTSGFFDADGDAKILKYIWTITGRSPIETSVPELDLSMLSPALPQNPEALGT
ncbi:MAG: hypothetical protein R3A47_06685 [Polyangiales bacterium]